MPITLPHRQFRITAESLSKAIAEGLTPSQLTSWFERRARVPVPPAVRLLLIGSGPPQPPLPVIRPLLLVTPSGELLDGLIQHPETRPYLGERIGPRAVVIPEAAFEGLRRALRTLGLTLNEVSSDSFQINA